MKALKIIGILVIAVTAFLIIANPSYSSFQEFAPERDTKLQYAVWKRVNNYLVYSIYQKDLYKLSSDGYYLVSSQKYIGFLFNFRETY